MNTNYIHIDNKAIISDENGNKKVIPYYDNLYKVLLNENLIEKLEEEINIIFEEDKKIGSAIKRYPFPFATSILSVTPSFAKFSFKMFVGPIKDELIIKLGNNNITFSTFIVLYFTALSIWIGAGLDFLFYRAAKNNNRLINANSVKIEYLKKELNLIKEELKGLNSNKTNSSIQKDGEWNETNLENNPFVKDYVNQIINIYYKLGYDEKKLYKYYLQGKLNKVFEGNNLNLATKYFEEKGNVLSKKYNIKKK